MCLSLSTIMRADQHQLLYCTPTQAQIMLVLSVPKTSKQTRQRMVVGDLLPSAWQCIAAGDNAILQDNIQHPCSRLLQQLPFRPSGLQTPFRPKYRSRMPYPDASGRPLP